MKQRCLNPNNHKYPRYGARGIIVCDEWKNDFHAFDKWARTNGYKRGLSIDRIDVNGNYEPSNCRWATQKTQQNNRSNNHMVTLYGHTQTLHQWADELHVEVGTLRKRLEKGVTGADLYTEKNLQEQLITVNGVTKNAAEWNRVYGYSNHLVHSRIEHGWDPVRAVITPPRKGHYKRGQAKTVPTKTS